MTSTKLSNATVVDKCTQRLQAMKNYVKNHKTEMALNGVSHKASEVIAIYQTCLDTRAALSTKRAETKVALSARTEAEDARRETDRYLKGWVVAQFGVNSQQAIDFGFPPPKVASLSVEDKTNAVARAKATRAARHTMGSRQKKKIVGGAVASTAPAAPANTVPLATPSISTHNQAPVVQNTTAPQASFTAPVVTAGSPVVANGASPVPSGPAPIATGTAPQTNGAAAS